MYYVSGFLGSSIAVTDSNTNEVDYLTEEEIKQMLSFFDYMNMDIQIEGYDKDTDIYTPMLLDKDSNKLLYAGTRYDTIQSKLVLLTARRVKGTYSDVKYMGKLYYRDNNSGKMTRKRLEIIGVDNTGFEYNYEDMDAELVSYIRSLHSVYKAKDAEFRYPVKGVNTLQLIDKVDFKILSLFFELHPDEKALEKCIIFTASEFETLNARGAVRQCKYFEHNVKFYTVSARDGDVLYRNCFDLSVHPIYISDKDYCFWFDDFDELRLQFVGADMNIIDFECVSTDIPEYRRDFFTFIGTVSNVYIKNSYLDYIAMDVEIDSTGVQVVFCNVMTEGITREYLDDVVNKMRTRGGSAYEGIVLDKTNEDLITVNTLDASYMFSLSEIGKSYGRQLNVASKDNAIRRFTGDGAVDIFENGDLRAINASLVRADNLPKNFVGVVGCDVEDKIRIYRLPDSAKKLVSGVMNYSRAKGIIFGKNIETVEKDFIKKYHDTATAVSNHRYSYLEFRGTSPKVVSDILKMYISLATIYKGAKQYRNIQLKPYIVLNANNFVDIVPLLISSVSIYLTENHIGNVPYTDLTFMTKELATELLNKVINKNLGGFKKLGCDEPKLKLLKKPKETAYYLTSCILANLSDFDEHSDFAAFWANTDWFDFWITFKRLRTMYDAFLKGYLTSASNKQYEQLFEMVNYKLQLLRHNKCTEWGAYSKYYTPEQINEPTFN